MDAFSAGLGMRGKSKFGGQANRGAGAEDGGRYDDMAPEEVKEKFLARLKIGLPLVLYEIRGRGKPRKKRFVEMYTDNDARTLKVDSLDEEKYFYHTKNAKRVMKFDRNALVQACAERTKARAAEKMQVNYSKMARREANYELRTVDIKDLWQADVEYGDLEKHTLIDWADSTKLDLEGSDLDETLFLHKGLALCLDDWTKDTAEYSDFWDSL